MPSSSSSRAMGIFGSCSFTKIFKIVSSFFFVFPKISKLSSQISTFSRKVFFKFPFFEISKSFRNLFQYSLHYSLIYNIFRSNERNQATRSHLAAMQRKEPLVSCGVMNVTVHDGPNRPNGYSFCHPLSKIRVS